jgi:lipid II:glycine glycyltransferase (peptidoglycan interpeptide bridge formation enzyme)
MQLIEFSEKDKDQYNQFVAAQESGSFLQSFEWGEWQKSLGREVFRYWILNDIGNKVASAQLIKMRLPFGKYYLYAPYGPVLAEGEQLQVVLRDLRAKFPDAVFFRIEPKDKSLILNLKSLIKSSNIQPGKTLLIDLSKTEDQLLADMHHKTRYNIKVAQKHAVEIKDEFAISIGHGLFFEEALKLILETSQRQEFLTFSSAYYKKLADFFALHNREDLHLHIYKAIYQNQLLASAIIIDFSAKGESLPTGQAGAYGGGTRTFLFGGSSDEYKNVMAPYLLHWQAMLDAKAKGFGFYDFWGIETSSGETPGFVRFKLGFGGVPKEYAGAYDIINSRIFYKIYKIFRKLNKIIKSSRNG